MDIPPNYLVVWRLWSECSETGMFDPFNCGSPEHLEIRRTGSESDETPRLLRERWFTALAQEPVFNRPKIKRPLWEKVWVLTCVMLNFFSPQSFVNCQIKDGVVLKSLSVIVSLTFSLSRESFVWRTKQAEPFVCLTFGVLPALVLLTKKKSNF